jgi:hypothetical protein
MDGRSTDSLPRRAGRNVVATVVVVAMVVAALSMWTIIPFSWIWVGSKISETQEPSGGPYMVVLVGIVTSILVISWLLGRLNRIYVHMTGTNTVAPIRPAWLKSMRDEREARHSPTVLETVIVTSVILAIIAMAAWFFLAAGSPLPNQ